ncbi:MAG: MCP four helix bundle domain-containing protein, partial [Pseudomonadota bacterium]|nr:MCP four helix bundle domain-containing protein [Pseudomonadota bacterium]
MKVSTKIGGSFFLLSAFVLIGGIAGYYGIHRLSQSLDFVTQNAWNAADGAMEAVIGIQQQMIALERLIARTETRNEQEDALSKTLLENGKSMMNPAIERMMASGLMSNQSVSTLNEHLPAFLEKQAALLAAHEHYRNAHIQLDENRLQFFQAIGAAETFVYNTADTLNNKLETLELKRTAIDGIREIRTHLLERSFYFEEWLVGDQEQQNLRALALTLNKLENQVAQLIRHPFFRTALDNPKTDAQALQSLLEQHQTDFSETIKSFQQFKAAQVAYFEVTDALLNTLTEIEHLGDTKVEGETQAITRLKYSSKLIIIIAIIIALLSALIASWLIVRAITIPLEQTKDHLKMLAQGQVMTAELNYKGNDEIAEIVSSTRQLKFSVQTIIDQASAIAAGDYSNDIQLLSEADRLGQALLSMTQTLRGVIAQTQAIAAGDYSKKVQILSDRDQLGRALKEMTTTLQSVTEQNARQDWLKTGQTQLSEHTSGEQDINHLTKNIISFLSHYLNAEVGLLYLLKTDNPPCL